MCKCDGVFRFFLNLKLLLSSRLPSEWYKWYKCATAKIILETTPNELMLLHTAQAKSIAITLPSSELKWGELHFNKQITL